MENEEDHDPDEGFDWSFPLAVSEIGKLSIFLKHKKDQKKSKFITVDK